MAQMKISKRLRERCNSIDFQGLESFMTEYRKRHHRRIERKKKQAGATLGYNGVAFLLCTLARSRSLYVGFIDCINRNHPSVAFLSARAHSEVTGTVACLQGELDRFYKGAIDHKTIDSTLFKLSLGSRDPRDASRHPEIPKAMNVLSQIDAADKYLIKLTHGKSRPFREYYNFFSEFCHPNYFGLTIAVDLKQEGRRVYHTKPDIKKHLGILVPYLLNSCTLFFSAYDSSFSLLNTNELLPRLIK